jgi:hypothetical protein
MWLADTTRECVPVARNAERPLPDNGEASPAIHHSQAINVA